VPLILDAPSAPSAISGTIDEIITIASPSTPFKLRRTTWKRPDLYFVVEEIRGQYAYGYILDNDVIERKTSYPINNEKLQWNLQTDYSSKNEESACYDGENAKVTLLETTYDSKNDLIRLEFEIENYTRSDLNIYLINLRFGNEELEGFHSLGSIYGSDIEYATLKITDAMLKTVLLAHVSTISFRVEIDDSDYNELETSDMLFVFKE
jgi:hypothetical protein